MGKKIVHGTKVLEKISRSPLFDKVLVAAIGLLAGTMLDLILNKLESIEQTQIAHINEFKSYKSSERELVNALVVNQSKVIDRQEIIFGEQRQRTPMVYDGKRFPGIMPYSSSPSYTYIGGGEDGKKSD